jgi:hypothetical protein
MWRRIIPAIVAVSAALVAALVIILPGAFVQAGEIGTFINEYHSTITLADGQMLLNDQQHVRYAVGTDADGAYILPQVYVGA